MDAWLRNQIGNLATLRCRRSLRLAGSYLDACLLLAYNGYGGTENNGDKKYKNYLKLIALPNTKPYWTTKDNSENYVKKISEQAVPPPY